MIFIKVPNSYNTFLKLIASHNQMMRMYTVAKLSKLVKLDLSNNHLMSIEGLRDLINLSSLNLSNNKIKVSVILPSNVKYISLRFFFSDY